MSNIEGIDNVTANLNKALKVVNGTIDDEMGEIGDEVLRRSRREVPHDTGRLQNSGSNEKVDFAEYEVGYHTPYALRLHEHPEYHFNKGRKGKYLEDPAKEVIPTIKIRLSGELKKKGL